MWGAGMKLQFQDRLNCPHSYNSEDNKNLQCDYEFCEICDGTLYEHCLWDMDERVIERCKE